MDELEIKIKKEFDDFFITTDAFKTITQGSDVRGLCFQAYRAAALPLLKKMEYLEDYKSMYENNLKGY